MTTIAALKRNGRIAVAADGAAVWGGAITTQRCRKILHWENGAMVAASGDARVLRLLEHAIPGDLAAQAAIDDKDPEHLWQAIKLLLIGDGVVFALPDSHEQGVTTCGSSFIFVIGENLYEVDGSGWWRPDDRAVLGSGCAEAYGALEAISQLGFGVSPECALEMAISIAKQADIPTGGDTLIVSRPIFGGQITERWIGDSGA